MNKQLYLVWNISFFITTILIGCNREESKQNSTKNCIVLVFDSIKSNYDTLTYKGGYTMIETSPLLSFKSFAEGEYIPPIIKIESDTINLDAKSDYLLISYRYNPISTLDFIVRKGDTIVIDERRNTPFFAVKNRDIKEYDVNYDFQKKARYGSIYDYSTEDYMRNPQSLYFIMKGVPWQEGLKEATKKRTDELRDEVIWLDSLYSHNLLSEFEHEFYKTRNYFQLSHIELENSDTLEIKGHLEQYNDSIFKNDRWGFYAPFYWSCLDAYLTAKAKKINNKYSPDFCLLYDLLDNEELNLGHLSLVAKLRLVERIVDSRSITVGQEYYNKMIKQINDTTLRNNLTKKYSYLFDDSINNSNDIELSDQSGRRLNFKDILTKNEGKIVYVDFWASWCMPCLKEMPASQELRKKYADKVAFVYLAIYDKENEWKNIIPKAGLNNAVDNYLILNFKTSPILQELGINTIPRYIIYDKKGKLIQTNAPKPSDNEIEETLQNYLKQE